ncbi:FIG00018398: hypothetical regulator [hydrothermal vent metagenome]|uniref:FIG00018398: hypothetical regulator n=1 Tax=hydrothermal vent metagenome TaxID=652676 RepID=A0A3B0TCZ8_9ZZZZ
MNRTILLTGTLFGLLAVVFGAFGAHGLKDLIDADAIQTFETGVRYQMYHALFLLVLGSMTQLPESSKKLVYYFIVAGIFMFSFSIYLLATNSLTGFDFKTIGFITPLGGLLLILGWVVLGLRCYQNWK